jgi:hypothetical protein
VRLDSRVEGRGVLWLDDDEPGLRLYSPADSGPARGSFSKRDMEFYASDVVEIEDD